MEFIDITMPIRPEMAVWPGDPAVHLERTSLEGEPSVTRLTMGTHTGTHIDTASHITDLMGATAAGKDPVASPFPAMIGACVVAGVGASSSSPGGHPLVTASDIEAAFVAVAERGADRAPEEGVKRVLLCATGLARPRDVFLSDEAAEALLGRGVILVGVASSSVDAPDSVTLPAHRRLLGGGVVVLENLVLDGVAPGRYELAALPLRIEGADGAPVRALLLPAHLE